MWNPYTNLDFYNAVMIISGVLAMRLILKTAFASVTPTIDIRGDDCSTTEVGIANGF
jgi:hypothetical protein